MHVSCPEMAFLFRSHTFPNRQLGLSIPCKLHSATLSEQIIICGRSPTHMPRINWGFCIAFALFLCSTQHESCSRWSSTLCSRKWQELGRSRLPATPVITCAVTQCHLQATPHECQEGQYQRLFFRIGDCDESVRGRDGKE